MPTFRRRASSEAGNSNDDYILGRSSAAKRRHSLAIRGESAGETATKAPIVWGKMGILSDPLKRAKEYLIINKLAFNKTIVFTDSMLDEHTL